MLELQGDENAGFEIERYIAPCMFLEEFQVNYAEENCGSGSTSSYGSCSSSSRGLKNSARCRIHCLCGDGAHSMKIIKPMYSVQFSNVLNTPSFVPSSPYSTLPTASSSSSPSTGGAAGNPPASAAIKKVRAASLHLKQIISDPWETLEYDKLPDLGMYLRCILQRRFFTPVLKKHSYKHAQAIPSNYRTEHLANSNGMCGNSADMKGLPCCLLNSICSVMIQESVPYLRNIKRTQKHLFRQQQPQQQYHVPPSHSKWNNNHAAASSNNVAVSSNPLEVSCCIQVMYGTLMKLYPRGNKRPIFRSRVALARRLREIMVHCSLSQKLEFLQQYNTLARLCFMEYVINILHDHLPCEREILHRMHPTMGAFEAASIAACDFFRQECILTGEETWKDLNDAAAQAIEKSTRVCKFRAPICRQPSIKAKLSSQLQQRKGELRDNNVEEREGDDGGSGGSGGNGNRIIELALRLPQLTMVHAAAQLENNVTTSLQQQHHQSATNAAFDNIAMETERKNAKNATDRNTLINSMQGVASRLEAARDMLMIPRDILSVPTLAERESKMMNVDNVLEKAETSAATLSPDSGNAIPTEILQGADLLQRHISIHPLPRQVVDLQRESLWILHSACSRRVHAASHIYFCIACAMAGKGLHVKMRMHSVTGELFCMACPSAGTIVTVNMIGVILKVCSVAYYLCPCCTVLRTWRGDGYDLCPMMHAHSFLANSEKRNAMSRVGYDVENPCMCYHHHHRHCQEISGKQGLEFSFSTSSSSSPFRVPMGCIVCGGKGMGGRGRMMWLPCLETKRLMLFQLCSMHAPYEHVMQYVYNAQDMKRAIIDHIKKVNNKDPERFATNVGGGAKGNSKAASGKRKRRKGNDDNRDGRSSEDGEEEEEEE